MALLIYRKGDDERGKIIKDFIPKGNRNRPGNFMKPLYITVHNTANTDQEQMPCVMSIM